MKSLMFSVVLITVAYASTITEPIKVYFVVSSRSGDRTIERVYLIKENAEKYCNMYKDSHNYSIEEHKLSE
ncbi:MAG: hypothetical protein ACO3UU_11750 [Minisyncoccia bacterium]